MDRAISLCAAFAFALGPSLAQAAELPRGGSVAAGSASISTPHNGTLDIHQSSDRAVINWQSYSIGQGGTVNYHQPSAASATLNRVTGNTPSSIAGTINAPGTVLLVNPNGIAITKTGVVNVGSFAASTLDIKDKDFMSGNYKFTGNGNSAAVTNAGRINVSDGGFAALLGGQVANDGIIRARLGKVALGSGELITLDLAGDGFLSVAVPTKDLGKIKGADGQTLVTNRGKIVADGGVVELKAATAAGILRDAVNVPGSIQANSVGMHNGRIVLGGGVGGRVRVAGRVRARGRHHANGGKVTVTGATVEVSGKISTASKHGKGGVVILTAEQVTLGHEAKLDASGATGGTLLIGGDYQGGNGDKTFSITPVKNALTTTIAAGATLTADGTAGQGGNIVVWSNDKTTFAGAISARGTTTGGFAEVSGKKLLAFTGTADLTGPDGFGTLLLDPENITISNGSDTGVTSGSGTYTAGAADSILSVATLEAALASGNVVVTTGDASSSGAQAGNITVANAVAWSSGSTLTLTAANDIAINAAITATSGGLTINAANTVSATGAIDVGTFTLASGAWSQIASTLPTFSAADFVISGGSFLRVTGGTGTSATPYQVADVYGLQGIGSSSTLLAANWQLANNIDASGTANWNGGAGFATLDMLFGTVDGQNHTIDNLTINRASTDRVGLFAGLTNGAQISGLGLVNASISGGSYVGALAGANGGGTISNVYVTGSVTGSGSFVGGLVGQNAAGSISSSYATASVNGGVQYAGGLVGMNSDTISDSYATGAVSGAADVGGLTGSNPGSITSSYASGTVTATGDYAGGLSGANPGAITDSYATGAVSGADYIGGLTGSNVATINNAYATGTVTASGDYAGGLSGSNAGTIQYAYAIGDVSGSDYVGGLVGNNAYTIKQTYASGAVKGTADTGGLVGKNVDTVTNSYFDTGTTGQSVGIGTDLGNGTSVTGLSTAQAFTQSKYSAFLFTSAGAWYMIDGQTRPFLRSEFSTTITNAHQLQLMAMDPSASYTLANNIDASATSGSNASGMWTTAGFVPIGNDGAGNFTNGGSGFNGNFDGQYHIISGLSINRPSVDRVALFGYQTNGTISKVGLSGVNIVGQNKTGALVGDIYAGSVTDSFATGSVSGVYQVGGLIGQTRGNSGTFTRLYANVAVTTRVGSSLAAQAGGLIGQNGNTISQAYSTGPVTALNSGVAQTGGLVGYNSGTLTYAYYDSSTTGHSGNGTSQSTTQLQSALPTGFDSNWGIVAGQSYAYLKGFYTSGTPQVISGYARNGGSAATGAVSALVNGRSVGSTAVGANGYYNILVAPGTIGAGSQVVAYTSGANAGVSYQQDASSSLTGFAIYGGYLKEDSSATTLSAISSGLATAIGSSGVSTDLASRWIVASGASFTIDEGITQSGTLTLQAAGDVTQAPGAAIKAAQLVLRENSGGGSYTLLDSGNAIATLFANWSIGSGGVSLYDSANLTVTGSLAADGSVLIQTAGALTLNGSITSNASGNAIVLVDGTTFTNNDYSTALSTPNGRFLVYSQNSANDNVGGLVGGTIYNATYTGNPPASISASGNQFVYANAASKMLITYAVYGSTGYYGTTATTGQAILVGVASGADVTAVVSVYDSGGNLITLDATTPAGTYTEKVLRLTGADAGQYQIASTGNTWGTLTINKATLVVYVGSANKTYGATTYNGQPTYIPSGIKTGDTITSLDFASPGLAATAGVGNYALTASNAQGTGLSNYNISYQAGSLSVSPASLTIASGGSVAASKVYDGSTTATVTSNGTLSGVLNSDDVSLALGGTNYNDANAGTGKTVTGTYGLTGAAAHNYILLSSKSFTGTAAITQKTLTVATAGSVDPSKIYDGTTSAAVATNGALSGVVGTDDVALVLGGTTYNDRNVGTGKAVTGTYSLSGAGAGNYKLDSAAFTTTAAITPKTLTIAAVTDTKTYDGSVSSTAAAAITGLVSGDTASATQAFDSRNAGARTLSISGYSIDDGNGGNNYVVDSSGTAAGTINQATLTIAAVTDTKTYDGGASSSAAPTITGLVSGDTASATQAFDSRNAGVRTLSVSGYTIDDGNGGNNYAVNSSGTASGVIGKAYLTISAVTDSKTYDGTTTSTKAPAITGLQAGDSVTATQVFDSPNANARVLSISGYTVDDGNNGNNYVVSSGNQAQGVISKASLTVTAKDQEKTYGTAYDLGSTAFTTTGTLYGSDKITGVTLSSYAALATAAAGAQEIDVKNATGSGLSNYTITYVKGMLKVDPAPLTITVHDQTKTYGQSVAFGSGDYTVSGPFYNGDSISTVTLSSPGQYATATVAGGPYAITGSNANGPGSYNYAITYVPGKLTVDPARITAVASAQDKTYDGTTAATGSVTSFNGVRNGDQLGVGSGAVYAFADKNAGNGKVVNVSGLTLTGAAAGNYTLVPTASTTASIRKANLTISAATDTRQYDGTTNSSVAPTVTGLQVGDTVTATQVFDGKNAGTHILSVSNYTIDDGNNGNNYVVSSGNQAQGTIKRAPLTVTASDQEKTYGVDYDLGSTAFTTSGTLYGNDKITGVTLSSYAARATAAVGSQEIDVSNATGTGAGNYTITYVKGALKVDPADLTITASNQSKIYGDTGNLGTTAFTTSGLVNGDKVDSVALTSVGAWSGAAVAGGPYAIKANYAQGSALSNYKITYVDGSLAVTPRKITVTADNLTKTYGNADPALTYTVSGVGGAAGLVNGDTEGSVFTGALTRAAGETVAGGPYAITQGTLAANGNYDVTSFTPGALTITPASVAVSVLLAAPVTKTYDGSVAATVTSSDFNLTGVQTGDLANIGVTAGSASYDNANAGSNKLVTASGLTLTGSAASNYVLASTTAQGNVGTITQKTLTIATAGSVAGTKVYDGSTAAAVTSDGALSGVINGDSVTLALSGTAYGDKNVGTGKAVTGTYSLSGSAAGNYQLASAAFSSTADITVKTLTVATAGSVKGTKVYDGGTAAAVTSDGTLSGVVSGENVTLALSGTAYGDKNVGTGKAVTGTYSLGGADAGNYQLASTAFTTTADITPKTLTVATAGSVAASKVYDGSTAAAVTGNGALDGVITGDSVTLALGGTAYDTKNVGTGKTVTGTYSLSGSGAGNYKLASAAFSGTAAITPAPLTVTADSQAKYVGDADPLLTYQITSGALFGTDTLTGALTRAPGEVAGDFAILQGTLAAPSNYALTYVGAKLSILAAPGAAVADTTDTGSGYATSQYEASSGGGTPSTVNISYQNGGNGGVPVISYVGGRSASSNANTNVASTRTTPDDVSQNVATGSGFSSLFWPISQFDKTQYSDDQLPSFAPRAGLATVLAMVARAEENNRHAPKIDQLWQNTAADWAKLAGTAVEQVRFSDGNGQARKPSGDNGFAFVNGSTDIAALLQRGPVMLGDAAPGQTGASMPWLLAIKLTDDGKGIVANDPITGRQVVLAYDPATKQVGAVTGVIDPKTGKSVALGDTAPATVDVRVPLAAWSALKAFKPLSYFAVTL